MKLNKAHGGQNGAYKEFELCQEEEKSQKYRWRTPIMLAI